MDCIFCKIIAGEIPSTKVYEDARVLAFEDINPQSPVHYLVIPKIHFENVNDMTHEQAPVMADIFMAINTIVKDKGLDQKGYRLIINNGKAANQEVFHIHVHILAGSENLGPMLCK